MIEGAISAFAFARRASCRVATELARAEMILCGLRDALVEASRDPEADCAQESSSWLCARCVLWNLGDRCTRCDRCSALAAAHDPEEVIGRKLAQDPSWLGTYEWPLCVVPGCDAPRWDRSAVYCGTHLGVVQ